MDREMDPTIYEHRCIIFDIHLSVSEQGFLIYPVYSYVPICCVPQVFKAKSD